MSPARVSPRYFVYKWKGEMVVGLQSLGTFWTDSQDILPTIALGYHWTDSLVDYDDG